MKTEIKKFPFQGFALIACLYTFLVFCTANATIGVAQEGSDNSGSGSISIDTSVDPGSDGEESPEDVAWYRSSSFSYRNVASAISFNRDAEPTYNPYYAMIFGLNPYFWTGKTGYINLRLDLSHELTNADNTTEKHETLLSDITLGIGLSNFFTIPTLEVGVSTKFDIITPTSKISQARTLIIGLRPGFSLSRSFDVLSGLALGYSFGVTKNFHEATTMQREVPLIPEFLTSTRSNESFLNTGVRNASWEFANGFSIGLDFIKWLGASGAVTLIHGILYDNNPMDDNLDYDLYQVEAPTNIRYMIAYSLEIHSTPVKPLTIALGAETVNPQLAPDSTYETPFFNRYTAVYLDLRLDIAGLVSKLD
jgi:hypothetical protein